MQSKILITLLISLTLFCASAYSDGKPPFSERWKQSNLKTDKEVTRPDGQVGSAIPAQGDQFQPAVDQQTAAINAQFQTAMDGLLNQLNATDNFENQNSIQEQIINLKKEWKLARANRQLEIARSNKDTERETEILRAIQRMVSPPVRTPDANLPVSDPNQGIDQAVEGGAK